MITAIVQYRRSSGLRRPFP